MEFTDLKRKLIELSDFRGKLYIEPKSNGKAIVSVLREESALNIVELPAPRDSKMKRATAVTPKLESRRVKLLVAPWNESFLHQVSNFPNAKHDGIVDTLSYAVSTLLSGTGKLTWYM